MTQIYSISAIMFVTTFLLGLLPLACKFNPFFKDILSVYGGGLLLGAGLCIVLPEGIVVLLVSNLSQTKIKEGSTVDHEAALTTTDVLSTHMFAHDIGLALICGFALMLLMDSAFACWGDIVKNQDLYTRVMNDVGASSRSLICV